MLPSDSEKIDHTNGELQSILNAVVEAVCGLDSGGNITFCNDALLRMTGYRTEEIIGKNFNRFLHPRKMDGTDPMTGDCAHRESVDGDEAIHVVGKALWRKDGTHFPAEYSSRPLQCAGSRTARVATVRDITVSEQSYELVEDKFRRILANFPDIAWTSDESGRTVYISPKVESVLGYTPQEIHAGGAELWLGRIHPEDVERVKNSFGLLFAKEQAFDEEYRICRKDETWIWVHDRAVATHQENGVLYADGICSDITRRKQAELELQTKTAFLEAQANSTIDGILVVGHENQQILLNHQLMELFKIPEVIRSNKDDRLLLTHVLTLVKDPESFLARVEHLNRHPQETSRDEIEFIDGMILDRYSAPVVDQKGNYYGRIWNFRDITESKRNERDLRLTQFSIEHASDSIFWMNSRGRIVYVNRVTCSSLGLSREELFTRSISDIDPLFPKENWEVFWKELKTRGSMTFESQQRTKDGRVFPVEVTANYFSFDKQEYGFAFVRDVTERRKAEEKDRENSERVRLLLDSVPEGLYGIDLQGKCTFCNPACLQLLGYEDAADLLGRNMHLVLHHTRADGTPYPVEECQIYEAFRRGYGTHIDTEVLWRRDGTCFAAEYWSHPMHSGGNLVGTVVTFVDITERKRTQEALRESEERYRLLFERNPAGVFRSTMEGTILECNQATARIFGCDSPEEVLNAPAAHFYYDSVDREILLRKLKSERSLTNEEMRYRRRDGETAWVIANFSLVSDEGGVSSIEGTFVDITQRKVAEERVQSLAYYDALTGLPNRILLRDRLSKALALAGRQRHKVALLFLDLDRFKTINDSLGHSIGDLLLQEVSQRLNKCAREEDTVARLGGDEFLIVLTNQKTVPDTAVAAQRFMSAMAAEFVIQGHSMSISFSLGISMFPEHGADSETLIKNADVAMYSAKDRGRNNFQFFTADMNAQALERLTLEGGLRLALERQEFFLLYQPQMNIATGEIVGLEALLRWQHPDLGLVPPDQFIRIAENSGLIIPIGEWVLRTACTQARKWQQEGLEAVSVAVNVSAVQFRQGSFPGTIRTVLDETGLAPEYLELELTESLLLSNADVMFSVMRQLMTMGLSLAIDDFGTGYSSLSYLKQFPVSKLKIDRSFVRDVAVNADDAAIATAIISMAKSLNLKVIAEGVENEAQMSFLRERQCDEIQGYYFSKPLPAEEVAAKLRASYLEPHSRSQSSGKT
jgi:diguanylate cyclase (GGDEF)-like protein/PAS domain S-box-containing protein